MTQAHAEKQTPKIIASGLHFGDFHGFLKTVIDLVHAAQDGRCGRVLSRRRRIFTVKNCREQWRSVCYGREFNVSQSRSQESSIFLSSVSQMRRNFLAPPARIGLLMYRPRGEFRGEWASSPGLAQGRIIPAFTSWTRMTLPLCIPGDIKINR